MKYEKYEIVELTDLSGKQAKIYSVILDDQYETLFDRFIEDNRVYKKELVDIINRLQQIGHNVGARVDFFKEKEGRYGDAVCALFDMPSSNLRLYCMRLGTVVIILFGGGFKSKKIKAWQEDPKLSEEANLAIKLAKDIKDRIASGSLIWSEDKKEIIENDD